MTAIPRKFDGTRLLLAPEATRGRFMKHLHRIGPPLPKPYATRSHRVVEQEIVTVRMRYHRPPNVRQDTIYEWESTTRCQQCGCMFISPMRQYVETREEYRLAEFWASLRRWMGELIGVGEEEG